MRLVALTPRFERAFKRYCKKHKNFRKQFEIVLQRLSENPFQDILGARKLSGNLSEVYACSCGYDCRALFKVEKNNENQEVIVLIDIGSHDEVY